MQKIKIEIDDFQNYKHQFEIQQMSIESTQINKFKDIHNNLYILNKRKRQQLQSYNRLQQQSNNLIYDENQLDLIEDQKEQVLSYQEFLKNKLNDITKEKILIERKIIQLRESLKRIKLKPDKIQKQLNGKVFLTLNKLKINTIQFQKQIDRFRSQSEKYQENEDREVEKIEDSIKCSQLKINRLKQQNDELIQQIYILTQQEEIKKKQLQECFQISDYLEFFLEVKIKIIDMIDEQQEQNQQQLITSFIQIQKNSTRNEILSLVEEFYKVQDIEKLTNQIINIYNYLLEKQNKLANEYNIFTEEKSHKIKQIIQLEQEKNQLSKNCFEEQFDQQQQLLLNSFYVTLIEGPQVIHDNFILNDQLQNQAMCLIKISQKLKDMIIRLCNNIIWLSETTKCVPRTLDALCTQYLRNFTKNDFNLYVPLQTSGSIPLQKSTQTQKMIGQIIQINKRGGSVTDEEIQTEQKIEIESKSIYDFFNKLKSKKNYQQYNEILNAWNHLIKNALIIQKFQSLLNFETINIDKSQSDIICQIYDCYYNALQELNLYQPFSIQFQYFKDIMRFILKGNSLQLRTSVILKNKLSPEKISPFILQQKQTQIKRLQEFTNSTQYDNSDNLEQLKDSQKRIKTQNDKYHEYFILESNKIHKQLPILQDKLITQTLQNIEQMKLKEMNDNYQQSDLIVSDQEYLTQERRNLKGILSKKHIKPQTADQIQKKHKIESYNQNQKLVKQVGLLQKINQLSLSSRVLEKSNTFNINLHKYVENVKRKISDYFTSDFQLDFGQVEDKSILLRPQQYDKITLSGSRSVEHNQNLASTYSEQILPFDRIDSYRYLPQHSVHQTGSSKKELKFQPK